MTERSSRAGQLDAISEAIGELRAYVHEHRHGMNNVSQQVNGLGVDIAKRIEQSKVQTAAMIDALEAKIGIRLDKMEQRIDALEAAQQQTMGAKNILIWMLQSPVIGWIVAAALFFAALWAKDKQ